MDKGLHKAEVLHFGVKQYVQGGICCRQLGKAVPSYYLNQWEKEGGNMQPGLG